MHRFIRLVLAVLAVAALVSWSTPVQAQDTPGFIVNHAGRGFGTEALRAGALQAQRAAEENWRISKKLSAFLDRL